MRTNSKDYIFVFGSNLKGIHGAGAARHARYHYDASSGVGEGITGLSYAIPTKDHNLKTRSPQDIKASICKFLLFAEINKEDMIFGVTPIGCGLAGYTRPVVMSWFRNFFIPENVLFTREWFDGDTNEI